MDPKDEIRYYLTPEQAFKNTPKFPKVKKLYNLTRPNINTNELIPLNSGTSTVVDPFNSINHMMDNLKIDDNIVRIDIDESNKKTPVTSTDDDETYSLYSKPISRRRKKRKNSHKRQNSQLQPRSNECIKSSNKLKGKKGNLINHSIDVEDWSHSQKNQKRNESIIQSNENSKSNSFSNDVFLPIKNPMLSSSHNSSSSSSSSEEFFGNVAQWICYNDIEKEVVVKFADKPDTIQSISIYDRRWIEKYELDKFVHFQQTENYVDNRRMLRMYKDNNLKQLSSNELFENSNKKRHLTYKVVDQLASLENKIDDNFDEESYLKENPANIVVENLNHKCRYASNINNYQLVKQIRNELLRVYNCEMKQYRSPLIEGIDIEDLKLTYDCYVDKCQKFQQPQVIVIKFSAKNKESMDTMIIHSSDDIEEYESKLSEENSDDKIKNKDINPDHVDNSSINSKHVEILNKKQISQLKNKNVVINNHFHQYESGSTHNEKGAYHYASGSTHNESGSHQYNYASGAHHYASGVTVQHIEHYHQENSKKAEKKKNKNVVNGLWQKINPFKSNNSDTT